MVLRNVNPLHICNGTWYIVKKLMLNCIEVTIATGHSKRDYVFLPRIPLIQSDANLPFEFHKLQFPVRICFNMSINKAQGQSLTEAGLYLQALMVRNRQALESLVGHLIHAATVFPLGKAFLNALFATKAAIKPGKVGRSILQLGWNWPGGTPS